MSKIFSIKVSTLSSGERETN